GCGASALELRREACERADPEACYDTARDAAAHADVETTRDELARQQGAFDASTCLAQHPVAACFHAVIVEMREPARGVLADYAVPDSVLAALPAYTGDEATGPLATARDALAAMCSHPGDPIGRARACIALGDLITLERAKLIAGWDRTLDGYTTACNLAVPDPLVRATYHTDACGIADSPMRGSSIFEGRENLERLAQDAAMRAQAEADAAKREAERLVELQAQESADQEAAKRAQETERLHAIMQAASAADWPAMLEALRAGQPLDPPSADTFATVFPAFSTWLSAQSSVIGAQLELDRDLGTIEPDTALATAIAALRTRAVAEAKRQAGSGPGGRFIHAALLAAVSHDAKDLAAARTAFDALAVAARANLVIDQLPPACAPLVRTVPGHAIHATAKLTCDVQPEHTWTETDVQHRGWRLAIHGELRVAGNALPIDIADSVDETTPALDRPFAPVLAGLIDAIWKELIAPIDAATATAALAAGRAALAHHDVKRAENELAIHAVLAGASEELDQLLAPDRVTFGQLVPAPAATR
ncbi:MAG TPA: hypothetical protein VIV58_34120, partial [Kofleriaceae bacterium]